MTQRGIQPKISWWGRLDVRVIGLLVLLGVLCLGASAYLVRLTIGSFENRVQDTFDRADAVAEGLKPFHEELIAAHVQAFEARGAAVAAELMVRMPPSAEVQLRALLLDVLERERDVAKISVVRPGDGVVSVGREATYPRDAFDWYEVETKIGGAASSTLRGASLLMAFRIDPEIDARYQTLGERRRDLNLARSTQPRFERAVFGAVAIAIGGVVFITLAGGFWLARATTRKVGLLSEVMRRVAEGDLSARAQTIGRDELGQLAAAFNRMLEELDAAQRKVAYLQRIAAWQDVARRIAHQIKNPLTPIQLAAQQVREKDPGNSPEFSQLLRTSVGIIEDEVEGLRRMVQSFSRLARVPEMQRERTTVARFLEDFARTYGHLVDENEGELIVDHHGVDANIDVDRQQLKQALVNLVENARQAIQEAGRDRVLVRVGARADPDSAPWVELWVEDNGPGIPLARRETVFEPYETSRREGTGLGLAIVKKTLFDHGGEVRVEDSELGGAAFVLRLRVASAAP